MRHFHVLSALAAILFTTSVWASAPAKQIVVRDRDTPDGLYESSYNAPTVGEKVADLDEASIRAYFDSFRKASEDKQIDLESGKEVPSNESDAPGRRILYVTGVPLFGPERAEVLNLVRSLAGEKKKTFSTWLRDLFYFGKSDPNLQITPISRPKGRWKLLQQLAYISILPRDMAPITPEVLKHGIQSVVISASIGVTVQFLVQVGEQGSLMKAMAIVVPAALVNAAQSAWTTLPRNWWQNYFTRSKAIGTPLVEKFASRSKMSDRAARIIGSVAQQIWMSVFFTFNVFVAGQGSVENALKVFSGEGIRKFAMKKWPSVAMNLMWRTPSENAIADFAVVEAAEGRGKAADVEAAKIRKVLTIIATNLWVYSTLTHMNWEFLGAKWNLGHAGLAVLAVGGSIAWAKPKILRIFTRSGRCANAMAALTPATK